MGTKPGDKDAGNPPSALLQPVTTWETGMKISELPVTALFLPDEGRLVKYPD